MHGEMKIYFPEYKEALGKVDGAFSLELLKQAPFPDELVSLGEDGIRQNGHDAKLRWRCYNRAEEIIQYAESSVGIKDGAVAGKAAVKWFVWKVKELYAELAVIEKQINQKCLEIPYASNILDKSRIGEKNGLDTGCFMRQSQQWHMRQNLKNAISTTIRHGLKIY